MYIATIMGIVTQLEKMYYNESESVNNNVVDFVDKQIRYYIFKLKSLREAQVMLMKYKINFMVNSINQLNKLNRSEISEDEKKILSHKIREASKDLEKLNSKLRIFITKNSNDLQSSRYLQYLDDDKLDKTIEGDVLDMLKLTNVCCRRHMLTHVNIF
jgi:DNA-directed RNA polymerase subunit N (RpoN/RPB10)